MKSTEAQEARLHDEAILLLMRNVGKPYIWSRVLKRLLKCLALLKQHIINKEKYNETIN